MEFEIFTAVVMKSSVFWDITQCIPLKACLPPPSRGILGLDLFFDPEDGGDVFLRNFG
jgi:hypothetical protein